MSRQFFGLAPKVLPARARAPRPFAAVMAFIVFACCLLAAAPAGALADDHAPAPTAASPADAKVQQLMQLLSDPDVRATLERSRPAADTAPEPASAHTMTSSMADRLQGLRNHIASLGASVGDFPSQTEMAHRMARDALGSWGYGRTIGSLIVFVLLGFGGQGLFHLAGRRARQWLLARQLQTVEERLQAVFARLIYGLGIVASFALCSIGAFLLFDWPQLIKAVLLGFLFAFLIVRLAGVLGRFLLAPAAERFRVIPMTTRAAWFLHVRLLVLTTIAAFGWQNIGILTRFGFSPQAQELSTDAIGLLLLAVALEALWRLPPLETTVEGVRRRPPLQNTVAVLLSALLPLLWLVWAIGAVRMAAVLAFAITLPLVIFTARASVTHILRPTGEDETDSFSAVLFERGVRSIIIISAALLLAWIFDVDVVSLTMRDTVGTRVLRGLISVVVIALAAEFLWTLIRALIDRKLSKPLPHAATDADTGHAARLQTLLPIVGNFLLATIVIIAGMMMLSALGVQIGPLIASAGVVGVAIGFGAQTLVRDVISGIFYLVDDAFRIGEYIQSGSYKGTVESFSLRSVKLRHQRGALYTVPFGVLGAVQNQSRDWVVDKILMNVPYGTDLEKVRKLIKRIGETLAEDPEFAADIISPLKMQGVQQFGDYAIQIQTKMMTKPGDVQFMARRRALLLIKSAFEQNGIGFAVPTVQVSGDGPSSAAASAAGMALMAGAPKAAE